MSPKSRFGRGLSKLTDTLRSVASGEFQEPLGEQRFVVFAHARSGSTSFVRALERHPRIRVLNEPFSETFTKWNPGEREYHKLVTDERALDEQLDFIYGDVNGIKVLSYQLPRQLYVHMLREPSRKVIVVRRANLLQSVVSMMISEQTDVWHSWDVKGSLDDAYSRLQPLDPDDVRDRIAVLADEIRFYDEVLAERDPSDVLKVTYEDLYFGSTDRRRELLDDATRLLGLEPVTDEGAEALLDPSKTKLNSDATYARVPNARELDGALGNDENGRLFPLPAATA